MNATRASHTHQFLACFPLCSPPSQPDTSGFLFLDKGGLLIINPVSALLWACVAHNVVKPWVYNPFAIRSNCKLVSARVLLPRCACLFSRGVLVSSPAVCLSLLPRCACLFSRGVLVSSPAVCLSLLVCFSRGVLVLTLVHVVESRSRRFRSHDRKRASSCGWKLAVSGSGAPSTSTRRLNWRSSTTCPPPRLP
jgi:hypothetical protein